MRGAVRLTSPHDAHPHLLSRRVRALGAGTLDLIPDSWATRNVSTHIHFGLPNWRLLAARSGGRRVGGAAVAYDTEGAGMLEGRLDLTVL